MTKEELLKKKICLVSLGCDKNIVDSERILYKLQQFGFETITTPEQAQIIVVNTCAFIEPARVESINTVIEMLGLKDKSAEKIVVVGCLPSKFKDDIKQRLPGVDSALGTRSDDVIVSEICKLYNYVPKGYDLQKITPCSRVVSTPKHYAFLKIADGCDNHCSYCTIPQIRGKYVSEPMENLIAEAQELANRGAKELILVAQDVTRYGEDLYKKRMIVPLIKELSKIDGLKWIRLHYCYPEFFSDELIEEMATNPKVCKYVDITIQHINNNILQSMNRNITSNEVISLINNIRLQVKDIAIRTTLIVGYPNETKLEFDELKNYCYGVSFMRSKEFKENIPMKITFRIQNNEGYILERLEREKRCGIVEKCGDNLYSVTFRIFDPNETMHWVKSFFVRIVSIEGASNEVKEIFCRDVQDMYALYGGYDDDGVQ